MTCTQCDQPVKARGLCKRHYLADWKVRNAEKVKAAHQAEYEANREVFKARAKAAREQHPGRQALYTQAWRQTNRETENAARRERRKQCPEPFRESGRQASQKRRARKAAAPINDFTLADWRALLEEHGHCCAYCGADGVSLQQEHKVPLVRGGSHTKANIVPACAPCNFRKGTMTDEEFGNQIRALAKRSTYG